MPIGVILVIPVGERAGLGLGEGTKGLVPEEDGNQRMETG